MKRSNLILLFLLSLSFLASHAQEFYGEATYKTHRKLDIKLDSTQVNSDMHQMMIDMMKKQFQKTYILSFNKSESLYVEDEKLGAPQPSGMQIVVMDTGGSDKLYKNIAENRFASQNDVYGKIFLVKDELPKHEWKMTGETKFIGDYQCYQATMTREVESLKESGVSVNDDKEFSDEMVTEEQTITAWYTLDIPVNNGPSRYHGLPGLILEVNDGSETIICSKVVLNPDKEITISEPKKGKEVNQEKYDAIMDKKMKEMRERYDSSRKDGNSVNISIRG